MLLFIRIFWPFCHVHEFFSLTLLAIRFPISLLFFILTCIDLEQSLPFIKRIKILFPKEIRVPVFICKMPFPLSTQSVLSSISTPNSFSYFLLQIHLTVSFSWATMVSQVPSSFFEVLLLFFLTLGILFVTEWEITAAWVETIVIFKNSTHRMSADTTQQRNIFVPKIAC